jgi:NAD-specific glutamate dehydrogenase
MQIRRIIVRSVYFILSYAKDCLGITETISKLKPIADKISQEFLTKYIANAGHVGTKVDSMCKLGVSSEIATKILVSLEVLDLIYLIFSSKISQGVEDAERSITVFYKLCNSLQINKIRQIIGRSSSNANNYWVRVSYRLLEERCMTTLTEISISISTKSNNNIDSEFEKWYQENQSSVEHILKLLHDIDNSGGDAFSILTIFVYKLKTLTNTQC